jgi:hypothetical protein
MLSPYRTPYRKPSRAPSSRHRRFFWAKVVSLLALVFLATSTATMAILAWNVNATWRAMTALKTAPPLKPVTPPARPPEGPPVQRRADVNTGAQAPSTALGTVFSLSALGRPTHAPDELFRRAKALTAAGIDLLLTETRITTSTRDDIERELTPSARIAPALVLPGIRIWSLPPGSLARAAGLTEGDLVTAVNGYTIDTPDAALAAYTSLRQGQSAVIELLRAGRHMVIKVDWTQAAPARARLETSMSSIL